MQNGVMDEAVRRYRNEMDGAYQPLFDRLHRLMVAVCPDVELVLAYGMPTYRTGRRRLNVGVWKHGLSLYVSPNRDGGFSARHPELAAGKATIKLRPADAAQIPDAEFQDLFRAALLVDHVDVPGARLHYERRGTGPLLMLVGSPMDSTGFAALAGALADRYTVVTYDPRGIGGSSREDATEDVTPEQQADDVHRLLSALGGEPAHVFGSSGGAVVGLALVTAHPEQVRTLVAHEPPVVELLPDAASLRAQIQEVYDTYRADGAGPAMAKFMAHTGLGGDPGQQAEAPRWAPSPEQMARISAATEVFLAHLIRPTTRYRPDLEALQAASTRVVVAAGATSKGQLANRCAMALADQLGTPVIEFPGDHGGFMALPEPFGRVLDQVLTQPS